MSLFFAAEAGNLAQLTVLVEQGEDKNQVGRTCKETALGNAARNNRLPVVRYLVEQGADIEKACDYGYTPLIDASFHGHFDVVRYLLEQGADRDKATKDGQTSLHFAARSGRLDIAKLLMVYGADLNARNNAGQLPIDVADVADDEEIKQAIRDEPRRRLDEAPGKRATEQDRHPDATDSASAQQDADDEAVENGIKQAAGEGEVAEEDQDSEPSSDEEEEGK